MVVPETPEARRELLADVYRQARGCVRCPHLAATRTQVVFGAGNADADVMFVGEAPGADEDREGVPFIGRAGRLLSELLGQIGLAREDVFIANVLKCRPPGNRNPTTPEIENCSGWLFSQLELVQPTVVVTLGNYATKLLREDQTSITRIRGQAELRTIGPRAVRLLPVLHPAAALYTPSNRELLERDLALLPALVALGAPPQPQPGEHEQGAEIAEARELPDAPGEPQLEPELPVPVVAAGEEQLGLF